MNKYRHVSFLDIDSKVFERCLYEPLYKFFADHLVKEQLEFVRNRSVWTNMLPFLQRIHFAMNSNSQDNVVVFHADFSEAFNRVPLLELIKKIAGMGVGGCMLKILFDY